MTKETILFNNSAGTQIIDFTENGRIDKFGNDFELEVSNVADNNTEENVQDFKITKTTFGSLITEVKLDGITGNGFIVIRSKKQNSININVTNQ